jgi:hypothetical protein
MEELQSTEILDREILEDARKKAHRILKASEDAIKAKSVDWDKNLDTVLSELEEKYTQQRKFAADEIMASLPIDKRRAKAKKIEELLSSAVQTWYARLSRQRMLDLLEKDLAKRTAEGEKITAMGDVRVQIHQIKRQEAEAILQKVLPGKPCVIEEIHSTSAYPEIILETPQVRIYASISKIVDFFLGEKRAELIEALLGGADLADNLEISGGGAL